MNPHGVGYKHTWYLPDVRWWWETITKLFLSNIMVKVMYNDQLVYKVVIWVFVWISLWKEKLALTTIPLSGIVYTLMKNIGATLAEDGTNNSEMLGDNYIWVSQNATVVKPRKQEMLQTSSYFSNLDIRHRYFCHRYHHHQLQHTNYGSIWKCTIS